MYSASSTSAGGAEPAAPDEPGVAATPLPPGALVALPPPVQAAMNALRPARPVPARNPRRFTRVRAIRRIRRSSSTLRSVISSSSSCPGRPGVQVERSVHQDEVRRFVPADRHRVARSESLACGFPQLVLTPDDELAGLFGLDPVLRLVAEVRALVDASRNLGPAGIGR